MWPKEDPPDGGPGHFRDLRPLPSCRPPVGRMVMSIPTTSAGNLPGQRPMEDDAGAAPILGFSKPAAPVSPTLVAAGWSHAIWRVNLQGATADGGSRGGGPGRRQVLHRPPTRRPSPVARVVDHRLASGDLHRWAAGAGRWGGGPISPAVNIHLGCRRESPAAAPSASPLWPSGAAANQVAFLVRNSTSSTGEAASRNHFSAGHAASLMLGFTKPCWRPVADVVAKRAHVAVRPDGAQGPTVPESGRNHNAVPPNSGVSLPAKIGRVSGGGTRPGGGRDDRWPGPPATGHEPGGGATIAGNQGIGPPGRGPIKSGRIGAGAGPQGLDCRVMAAPAVGSLNRCPSHQGLLAVDPRTSGEGLLEDTMKT